MYRQARSAAEAARRKPGSRVRTMTIITFHGRGKMIAKSLWLGAAAALIATPALAQAPVKIGFVNTFSGPTAVIGNDMRDALELALDHLGRKMSGAPVEVIYEDDAQKPEVGKQKTEKLIQSDKVNFVSGYVWSN